MIFMERRVSYGLMPSERPPQLAQPDTSAAAQIEDRAVLKSGGPQGGQQSRRRCAREGAVALLLDVGEILGVDRNQKAFRLVERGSRTSVPLWSTPRIARPRQLAVES